MDQKRDIGLLLAPTLYILNKVGNASMHKLFKLLYFADKHHLSTLGRSLTNDKYIAMKDGPVPSRLYDYIKGVAGKNNIPIPEEFLEELSKYITYTDPYYVVPLSAPDMCYLSTLQIKSLDYSVETYGSMDWTTRRDLSHDTAWHAVFLNTEMSILDMAKDQNVTEAMLQYINYNR